MNADECAQVRLILVHLFEGASASYRDATIQLYAQHSAKGMLRSGNTIHVSIENMGSIAAQFTSDAIDQVSAVAIDAEAFAMVDEMQQLFLNELRASLEGIIKMAGGEKRGESLVTATNNLFSEMETRLRRQLELHRFSFTRPTQSGLQSKQHINTPRLPAKGGRPPAEFWDDMWAAMAAQLYDGTLQPKTQADIERSMSGWITANGHDAGETTIKGRARRLWQAINADSDLFLTLFAPFRPTKRR